MSLNRTLKKVCLALVGGLLLGVYPGYADTPNSIALNRLLMDGSPGVVGPGMSEDADAETFQSYESQVKELQKLLQEANAVAKEEQSAKLTSEIASATDVLKTEGSRKKSEGNQVIKAATKLLKDAFDKLNVVKTNNPLELIVEKAESWFHEFYPKSKASLFAESDFAIMKHNADSILNLEEISEKDLAWAQSEPNLCKGRVNNLLVDYSLELKNAMEEVTSVESAIDYTLVHDLASYKKVKEDWNYGSKYLLIVTYQGKDDETIIASATKSFVNVYTANNGASADAKLESCNVLLVQEYGEEIKNEINWCKALQESKDMITQAQETLSDYFEGASDIQYYQDVIKKIQKCQELTKLGKEVLNRTDSLNGGISDLRYELLSLDTKWDLERQKLKESIIQAQNLLVWLSDDGEQNKSLSKVVNEALEQHDKGRTDLIIAHYITAKANLDAAYQKGLEYYQGLHTALETAITEATNKNNEWNDSDLKSTIQNAQEILKKAQNQQIIDVDISKSLDDLTNAVKLAEIRNTTKASIAKLESYIETYGDDEKGSMQDLIDRAHKITIETSKALWEQIEDKFKEVDKLYLDASENLKKLIQWSKEYYNKWNEKRNLLELKTAYETAEDLLSNTKKIAELEEAYDVLYEVFDRTGGNSDPSKFIDQLKEVIAEAELVQAKYNYLSLGQVIKEASGYLGSTKTYELQAQINALKAEMERTKVQYQKMVERSDEILVEVQGVLTKRYMKDFPEEYAKIISSVKDSLAQAEVQSDGIERACTNMEIVQQQQKQMLDMAKEVEAKWNQAVADLETDINEAVLKMDQFYQGNESLKQAILKAKAALGIIKDPKEEIDHTIAFVEDAIKTLESQIAKLESSDRRNMADIIIEEFERLEANFKIYGSDEHSSPTSNAKTYLEENKALYEELRGADQIDYTMNQLNKMYEQVLKVNEAYQLFCDAGRLLDDQISDAKADNKKYYDNAVGTGLDQALKKANDIRTTSYCLDSLQTYTYILRDSVIATVRNYEDAFYELKSSRAYALDCHDKYYGKEVESSEILDVCEEAQPYFGTGDDDLTKVTNIFLMRDMVLKLDSCYKQAADSCSVLGEKLQVVINKLDTLNVLMEDKNISNGVAKAINAKFAPNARIQAIINANGAMEDTLQVKTNQYLQAVSLLQATISRVEDIVKDTKNEELANRIESAELLLVLVDPNNTKSTKYHVLQSAEQDLSKLGNEVYDTWNKERTALLEELKDARNKALEMHNLYYGVETPESEIMDAYNKSSNYTDSKDLDAIRKMIEELNVSSLKASLDYAKKEANLKELIVKTTPLVTLMADETIAVQVQKAETALNVQNACIHAVETSLQTLQPVYDKNATDYDKAVANLGDTILISKDLLMQVRDEKLKEAIVVAEEAYMAADKTLETATLYADLKLQVETLSVENQRVRDIIITGIDGIYVTDEEVVVYSVQGMPMKRVKLSDKDCLNDLPAGIYIVKGKKVIID